MRVIVSSLVVILGAQAVLAQPDASDAACLELAATGFFTETPNTSIETLEGGCRIVDAYAGFAPHWRVHFEELTVFAPDLERALLEQRQFEAADISISGLRVAPDLGSPLANYVTQVQGDPLDLVLRYQWNRETGLLNIGEFAVTGDSLGRWSLSAQLTDIPDLGLARTGAVPFSGAVQAIVLEAEERNLVRYFLAPILLYRLPADEDPLPHLDRARDSYGAAIRAVPERNMDDLSKNTLTALVDSFPHVRGDFTLALLADGEPMPIEAIFDWSPSGVTRMLSNFLGDAAMADER